MIQYKSNRAHMVCVPCHARKVKCDLQDSPDDSCANCRRSKQRCVRRHGVRTRRKHSHLTSGSPATHSPPVPADAASLQGLGVLSPAQSLGPETSLAPHTFAQTPTDGYIDSSSVMSHDSATPSPFHQTFMKFSRVKDAILRETQAAVLPRPALLRALTDDFFAHVFPTTPVVDSSDVSGPNASVLLQQAVCLAGSLVRHDQDGLKTAMVQYEKVKTLIYFNYERDILANLKAMCLMGWWSSVPTHHITLDGPWQWIGGAIRLAIQMGLHRQATYEKHPQAACLRRILTYLMGAERLMVACWGRPGSLKAEDSDVQPLTADDFPEKTLSASTFLRLIPIVEIIGQISEINLSPKQVVTAEQASTFVDTLSEWICGIPEQLKLYYASGVQRPFSRHLSELYLYYFAAIILTQMVGKQAHQYWRLPIPSVVAASAMASLYEELFYREQTRYLPSIHGFLCMVAAIPLIYCQPQSVVADAAREEELEMLCSILNHTKRKYGGSELVYTKIRRLQREVKTQRQQKSHAAGGAEAGGYAPATWADRRLEERLGQLFPFPPSFCSGMELIENAKMMQVRIDDVEFTSLDNDDATATFNNFFTLINTLGMDMPTGDISTGEGFMGDFGL